jgi:phage FluMu protein Com
MAKVKFNKWKESVKFDKLGYGYRINGLEWWRTSSTFGRGQGRVKCPCCDEVTDVYIWSFCGSGKRCSNCNLLLSPRGGFVDLKEIPESVQIERFGQI